jgi:hypothetical protein
MNNIDIETQEGDITLVLGGTGKTGRRIAEQASRLWRKNH